ncbi:hypothetical protein V6C03_00390 [Methyloligella sp. 2.7D]|uniref:hypothetical protein n=1 Tax=unclassified Methyloligella TaxID=2625955 RepID=UPI00157C66B5|nr:hypothetical protein [Methyloligella sp. GL2]QKP76869.1 hypothetical protein HT051_05020 [Methyloligella sp. GL2]
MSISQSIKDKIQEKTEIELDIEIKKLKDELSKAPPSHLRKALTAPFRFFISNIQIITAIGVIFTLYLGVLSYEKDIKDKRDERFFSLTKILLSNAVGESKINNDAVAAAIGSIRSGYSSDKEYAFSTAFFVMPYAALKEKKSAPLRRIASQTLADSIEKIDDYAEFQAVFTKWYEIVFSFSEDDTPEFVYDTGRVVCALTSTFQRFGFESDDNNLTCERYKREPRAEEVQSINASRFTRSQKEHGEP